MRIKNRKKITRTMKSRIRTCRGDNLAPHPTLALNHVHNLTLHRSPSPYLNFSAPCETIVLQIVAGMTR